jgi:hypothetical protein
MSIIRTIVVISLLTLVSPVFAQPQAINLVNGEFDFRDKSVRVGIALSVLRGIDNLADFVQSPRPSEIEWVESERARIGRIIDNDIQISRFTQFYHTPEFQHLKLHSHLNEIKSALQCVVEPATPLQRELFCWSQAGFLMDETDIFGHAVRTLVSAKRLPEDLAKKIGRGSLDGIQLWYRFYSRGIQQHLVMPYLRGLIVK